MTGLNELIVARKQSDSMNGFRFDSVLITVMVVVMQTKPSKNPNGQICQICGDTVGVTANGDVFVACNECAFPVCRACYEYERKDGNQSCPQCKTRYKRLKG